jgi:hypothetical protein
MCPMRQDEIGWKGGVGVVSPRQTAIYVAVDVPYGSRYIKSVYYHAPRTVSENAYVKCGLLKSSRTHLTS